jgi:type IV secretory pathway TraG/TraD family ATPase VirD4
MQDYYIGKEWNEKRRRFGRRTITYDLSAHANMIAPTGGFKGASNEIPNLLRLTGVSVASFDTGQNYFVTHRWRGSVSQIALLDPFNHCGPDEGFNPLLSVHSYEDAESIGECLQDKQPDAHEPMWQDRSADFLGGLCWLEVTEAKAEGRTPTLEHVFGMVSGDYTKAAKRMVESGSYELATCGGQFLQDNRTIQGFIAHGITSMKWMRSEAMRRSLSVPKGIDWARLKGPDPLTVYTVLDADKLVTVGPGYLRLVSVCALNTLYRLGKQQGLTTIFMMSEMAQLGRLKPVLAALGHGRKHGIRLAPMVWQDKGQISRTYGKDGESTVLGNSGCLFAFAPGPGDNDTAEFLSKTAGSYFAVSQSASDDPQTGAVRVTINEHQERLWTPEMIRDLPDCHGLVWRKKKEGEANTGTRPQPVVCPPYWELDECDGKYDPDPYHPGPYPVVFGRKRPVGKMTGIAAALVALMIGAAAIFAAIESSHVLDHKQAAGETHRRVPHQWTTQAAARH